MDATGKAAVKSVPVTVSLRGHTSRRDSECTFPKLKLTLAEGSPDVLSIGSRTLKIGTHCGESADGELTPKFGRLPNEHSPWREATVYRILEAVGVPTLRARPARLTYISTSTPTTTDTNRSPRMVTRNAMLIEDEDDAIKRFGGHGEIDADTFTSADAMFAAEDASVLAFAQALIGNFDWCVKFTPTDRYRCDARMKLWNVIAAKTGGGKALPIMYDFDVSGMVTGSHRWFGDVFNASFAATKSPREVEVIAQLQRTRSLFSRSRLDATRQRFAGKRDAVYRALDDAPLDEEGRRQILEYLDAFYREIGTDAHFYRPVVTRPDSRLRAESDPSAAPVCTSRGPIPIGTPVSEPLERRGTMIRVVVLDALWHWAPPARCPLVQSGAPWIEAEAIGRDYPAR